MCDATGQRQSQNCQSDPHVIDALGYVRLQGNRWTATALSEDGYGVSCEDTHYKETLWFFYGAQ